MLWWALFNNSHCGDFWEMISIMLVWIETITFLAEHHLLSSASHLRIFDTNTFQGPVTTLCKFCCFSCFLLEGFVEQEFHRNHFFSLVFSFSGSTGLQRRVSLWGSSPTPTDSSLGPGKVRVKWKIFLFIFQITDSPWSKTGKDAGKLFDIKTVNNCCLKEE